jgi:hypothetical protein
MILADGSILEASKDQHPDLFWAVRGAGHCFGVALEFVFQAHPQVNSIWAGQMIFPASTKLEGVIDFANHLVENTGGDSAMVMGITQPPFMEEPAVIATVFHNGPESAALTVFKPLLDLEPTVNKVKERPYREMNSVMNHAVDYGGRKISKGASFKTPLSATFVRSLIKELKDLHSRIPGSKRSIMLFEFFHTDKLNSISSDEMAFSNRGTHQNLMLGPFWDNPEDDDACRTWARRVAKLVKTELARVTKDSGETIGEYGNYDGKRARLPTQMAVANNSSALAAEPVEIFGKNLVRLYETKKKYDPQNAFNKSHSLVMPSLNK